MSDNLNVIQRFLEKLGYSDITPENHWDYVKNWFDWYKGNVEDFHCYKIYNGNNEVLLKRKTLQLAKKCSEDWADLLLNEKVKIMVGKEEYSKILDSVLFDNNFYVQGNQLVETTFALGEGAFVCYKTGNKDKPVAINYCNANMIYPLKVENGEVVNCAFAWMVGDKYFVSIHEKTGEVYKIQNRFFFEDDGNIVIEKVKGIQEVTQSKLKLFQIIKPNIKNNFDIDCERGISVFANSLDKLKNVDLNFDVLDLEINFGRKRFAINSSVAQINIDDSGNVKPLFDPNDIVFYKLQMGENNKPIETLDSALRINELTTSLQTALNLFSDSVGFGMDYYTFKDGKVYTNQTQIINTNSKLFRRLKKHELILEKALIDLARSILYLYTGKVIKDDISVDFDDSIIEDKAEKQRQSLLEFNAGLIDEIQYFMQTRNMDESSAETFVKKIKSRKEIPDENTPEDEDVSES